MTVLKAVMPTSRRPVRALRVAVCLAGFAACGLASAARADDETDELKERFIRAFSIDKIGEATGLRKSEEEKAGIEYRERSPLPDPPAAGRYHHDQRRTAHPAGDQRNFADARNAAGREA